VLMVYLKTLQFVVFVVVSMKNVIWDVSPCGSCKDRHFGGTYRSLLQSLATVDMLLVRLLFSPWRWRWYIPSKRPFLQEPHGDIPEDDILHYIWWIRWSGSNTCFPPPPYLPEWLSPLLEAKAGVVLETGPWPLPFQFVSGLCIMWFEC
jgi:hypothetical protein